MSTTFIFEELDQGTREYLTAVRDHAGRGAPGVFANTKDSLPLIGCIAGPIVIGITLVVTLTKMIDVIYEDPVKVALLQTGGLLLGGWLLVAWMRGKGGSRNAGTWVYVDPLFLYEAYREQVTITPIDEVADANYTHNYDSNGNYQNSVVNILLGGRRRAAVTIVHEKRAEQMVTFLNYLAWARGPDGGDRADLGAADLGGLARYVVRNGDEPKDSDNNINLNLVELDITEVPEKPEREGRAIPAFLPYIFILLAGLGCFFLMAYGINPVLREDAIFEAVTKEDRFIEPRFLRVYLIDPRNTNKNYREKAIKLLYRFYEPAITHVEMHAENRQLGAGMVEVLKTQSSAGQPVVSVHVAETKSPPGKTDSKQQRQDSVRTQFADGVATTFANQPWGKPIQLPEDVIAKEPLPPLGHQLLAFVEPPEGAAGYHFDISYAYHLEGDKYRVVVNVTIRADIEKGESFTSRIDIPQLFAENELETTALAAIKDALVRNIVGIGQVQ